MRDTPGRIVIHQNQVEGKGPLNRLDDLSGAILIGLTITGLVAAIIAWRLRHQRRSNAKPADVRAVAALSRRLGVDDKSARRLEELAKACGVPALALLGSPSALRTAMEHPGPVPAGDRVWRKLSRLAGS